MNTIIKYVLALPCYAATTVWSVASAGEQKSVEDILAERNQEVVKKLFEISAPKIHGWQNIDLQHVALEYGDSSLYLVELNKPCPIMDSATSITLGHLGKTILKGDSITIWGEGGPGIKQGKRIGNCQIEAIYRLESTDKKMISKS